jgi:hypothetical protein
MSVVSFLVDILASDIIGARFIVILLRNGGKGLWTEAGVRSEVHTRFSESRFSAGFRLVSVWRLFSYFCG